MRMFRDEVSRAITRGVQGVSGDLDGVGRQLGKLRESALKPLVLDARMPDLRTCSLEIQVHDQIPRCCC